MHMCQSGKAMGISNTDIIVFDAMYVIFEEVTTPIIF